jgi:hypothetical protein
MNIRARAVRMWWPIVTTIGLTGALMQVADTKQSPPGDQSGLVYSTDPHHLWNRVHRLLHVRVAAGGEQFGMDEVDPLLWLETRYLLTEPSHSQAVRLLDEFLDTHGESLVAEPLERAVFQHDLWAVFDWLARPGAIEPDARRALMPRLARIIRRVALSRGQIEQLSDNYAAAIQPGMFADLFDRGHGDRAFLPRDMFGPGSSWTVISGLEPVAAQHAAELSRSAFSVLWRLPAGRAATVEYLNKLWDFPTPYVVDPFVSDGERGVMVNPAVPAVPDGTHIALVRKMLLVDRQGAVVPSALVETIQLRVLAERNQHFFEFRLHRRALFEGQAGGLQAVAPGDAAFSTFSSQGIDPFEMHTEGSLRPSEILRGCPQCHQQPGPMMSSILSLRRMLKPYPLLDSRHPRWERWFTQANTAADRKGQRVEWGLLQGFWQSNPW